jgi:hypothetical protein
MEADEQRRLQAHFGGLSDGDLQRLTAVERLQYRTEVLQMALDELARRRVPVLKPEELWRQSPEDWLAHVGLCYECWARTTEETLGAIRPGSGWRPFGVGLSNVTDPCRTCGSVTATKAFFVLVPVRSFGRYRVLFDDRPYGDPPRGRRLKDDGSSSEQATV